LAITSSQHSGFHLWDVKSGQQKYFVANRSHTITAAAFSQDNKQILLGTSLQEIGLWEPNSAKRVKHWRIAGKNTWQPSNTKVYALAFSSLNKRFYSITSNGILQQWGL
jgi:WD40 repeat protein